jgi:hypothetical protein
MSNIVKKYFRVLELISSLNCKLEHKTDVGRKQIPNLIERSQFNKRMQKLFLFLEEIRTKLASRFLEFEDYFIVDSMPLEIYKFSRYGRIKICKKDFETDPSKGFSASQENWFYGYKLHGVCSINGIFHYLDITKQKFMIFIFLKT